MLKHLLFYSDQMNIHHLDIIEDEILMLIATEWICGRKSENVVNFSQYLFDCAMKHFKYGSVNGYLLDIHIDYHHIM